jgi:hypothetical protein
MESARETATEGETLLRSRGRQPGGCRTRDGFSEHLPRQRSLVIRKRMLTPRREVPCSAVPSARGDRMV